QRGIASIIVVAVAVALGLTLTAWERSAPPRNPDTALPSPHGKVTGRATKPPATPKLTPRSAANKALLTSSDLGAAFSGLRDIQAQPPDRQCQANGQPPSLASRQASYGTDGITVQQEGQYNLENYSSIVERVYAYDGAGTSALARYLEAEKLARDNCSESYL